MPSNKKSFLKAIFKDSAGCGCCKAKESLDVHQPQHPNSCIACPSSSTLSYNMDRSSSCNDESDQVLGSHARHPSKMVSMSLKCGESVAVVKESYDPYGDFRESMLQMIGEKEIYSRDGLEELLKCFLDLNLPSHHEVIVEAFTEVWNEIISDKPVERKSGAQFDFMKPISGNDI